jgi:peptidoglycan hydrolase-like protein with peptidoglycan-binding domain
MRLTPDDLIESEEHSTEEPPRHRRKVIVLAGAGFIATVAVVLAAAMLFPPSGGAAEDDPKDSPAHTETVTRGDLTELVRPSGTLAYKGVHELAPELPGTITSLTAAGTVVVRGGELLRVNDTPVILMLGPLPAWREFAEGMSDGADVKQLEENLAALGFFTREPDQEFTWWTVEAVMKWQKALGLERTGTIEKGRIVFSPTDLRITGIIGAVGDQTGSPMLRVSENTKVVTVDLDANLSGIAPIGAQVEISLPNGSTSTGTVLNIGAPVEKDNPNGGKELKVPVTLSLDDQAAADGLDEVKVTATFNRVLAQDVLLVPVTALVALPGGGSAVDRVDKNGDVEQVEVELGAFADGLVEVTSGLEEGDKVVTGQ